MTTEVQANQSAGPVDIAQEKIKFWEKLSYFFATMSTLPMLTLTGSFLMIFYTDVVHLNPIAVGTLFLISRIVDAINDPITGYIIDRIPRTRTGKFRYVLMFGGIICSLNFLLLWFGPAWSTAGKLAIAYVCYLLLGVTFDIPDIAKNSLLPAMTTNPKERISLGSIGAVGAILGGTLFSIIAPIILAAGNSSMAAYSKLILITTGTVIFFAVFGGLFIKERVMPAGDATKYIFKDYLKIFTQTPVLALLGFNFLFATGYYLFQAVNAYFFTYVMKDLAMLGTVSLVLLVGLVPGILLAGLFSGKLGKKRALVIASLMMAAAFLIRWIDPTSVVLIYISTFFTGFTFGLWMPVSSVLGADVIDYVEYKLDYRSEPAVASINSFISKAGNGIAGAIPGFVLGLTGYIAGGQQQTASAINAITILSIGVPIIFFAVSALVFGLGYKLDKNLLQEVENGLSERRAAKVAQPK